MICSNYELIINEIEKLKVIWLKNAFPRRCNRKTHKKLLR